jgi:XTP/dITP diphosphohydrolase
MQICFATHNQNKVQELRSLLGKDLEILSLSGLNITEDIEETGATLKENALIKAQYVFDHYAIACFADDTGLEVDALNGAPGVYSARFAGEPANNERNIDKLLSQLAHESSRTARFRTVIAFVDGNEQIFFEGTAEGEIIKERKGTGGFGYDAVFLPKDFDRTFAEMSLAEKNVISHRAQAMNEFVYFLKQHS